MTRGKTRKSDKPPGGGRRRRGNKTPSRPGRSSPPIVRPPDRQDPPQEVIDKPWPGDFAVVGVGASAGGLEAFSQFLTALPADTGIAVVFVQHLAPRHDSVLAELLGHSAKIPVVQVTEGMEVQPDRVHVMPPNVHMMLEGRRLRLSPRPVDRTQHTPIDLFFRSLAEQAQSQSIGIVLSGTSSDGAAGLREIKAVGGITIAQEPRSAKYDGMPRAAVATGAVDLILTPSEMAQELARIARHPFIRHLKPKRPGDDLPVGDDHLQRIFAMLRSATGVDFTHYKQPTIKRRLQRRMVLHKITAVDQYLKYLQQNADEVRALYADILIHVTRFFREPESFETLAESVFPSLLSAREADDPIRIWVPGCATGEEAYSIAICLLEKLGDRAAAMPVQIFATDISDSAVESARAGIYSDSITEDVSPERLRRFFTRTDGSYRISKMVRDMCVFARQDLTRDPPFSRIDLIVCRNVLIYLGAVLQKRVMTVFHYALKPTGFLMLGTAETIGPSTDLFAVHDKRHRIYVKKTVTLRADISFPSSDLSRTPLDAAERAVKGAGGSRPGGTVQGEANRLILERYAPAGVIVDNDLQIVQFRGQTGRFLQPAPGEASLNLLKMAREGLLYGLRSTIADARRSQAPARREGLRVKENGGVHDVDVEVIPLDGGGEGRHFLILFKPRGDFPDDAPASTRRRKFPGAARGKGAARAPDKQVDRLQEELAASREYLQSIIQDLEAANEELQSANEEILSANEELQSTNEELDTAKEELQSTNEELNTVNEELHNRNEELTRANSDLVNLLGSVQIAIVMVARDLRIRRFTPMAERVLNLIGSDIGRPISDIKPNIDCENLEKLIAESIETVSSMEREVQDRQGNGYLLRIRPYKSVENVIDGAVLALFDVEQSRRDSQAMAGEEFTDGLLELSREPLAVLDAELHVRRANRAFYRRFQVTPEETEGRAIYDLGNGQWNIPALRQLLEEVLPRDSRFEDFQVRHTFETLGQRIMRLNGRRVRGYDGKPAAVLLSIEDVTKPALDPPGAQTGAGRPMGND